MSSSITLSAATRQNLQSLQDTAALAATNQNRLSTGKKVNSALDNPVNYFTAASLTDRSTALGSLLDGISNGIQTIQAASKGIDSITSIVKQMQSVVAQAQSNATTNLPKLQGTQAMATANEATATGKSLHDTVLAKTLAGTAAPASSTAVGVVGIDNTKADTLQLAAGNTVYNVSMTSGTVNDLVNNINKSGIATAAIDSLGQLQITGTGSDTLTVAAGKLNATTGALTADAGELAKLTGGAAPSAAGGTSAQRSALVSQFTALRDQLNQTSKDAGYNGTNLLTGDNLTIAFNEKTGTAQSKLSIQGNALTTDSLGIGTFVDSATTQGGANVGIQNNADLNKASDALTNALASLKSLSSNLGSNLSTVQNRQDFTKSMIDVLTTGAANLTNADMNEEAANSQALSTRQSLGISALSLANTANQGILQLLR
ncbi:flagellin [Methylobacterium sp. 092160098-2]|uniref:flagellin N-terminal helical domain-containing protein n=1 Tax=unclassified Methylobacterium TaxID=2615210 RepID=UPI0023819C79|nr:MULTISPECIES: flagellin [unclassified Methylobacterium]MDE4911223.1 flagellin [Methylobacterium sp. 092160098-2]WFS06489.1 flagellin [Methylobacterium sp. 391_Methyba4]